MNINEIQSSPSKISEGYKLKLERDTDMMVLNITDTATGKRTEVRGKPGYETNGYDKNDKLHQLLDKISKTANISDLMNGEPVGINPKHPDGASAKKATDVAFNENVSALASDLEAKYNLKSLFLGDMASRNAIELHSIIVNREDQGKGTGSKVMQELIKYADDNGKIMVLDPGLLDKQHGTTSQSRLRKFYKQFGFIDNKGRNKNYEFRNLMIRYPQSNESVNEVSKEEFDAIRNGYVDIEFDKKWWPLSSDYPLIKHIGEAIGATSWTSWGKVGVPWSEKEMIGGGGTYMLKGDFGHILLDASKSFRPDKILMSQISTSKRGGGVGVKVMNAIKSYADQKGLPLTIYKVTNKKFFDKFEWLTKTGEDTYEYNSSKNESINEAFDNPYPFKLTGPDESQSFVATAQTPNGPLIMEFSSTDFDDFGIDFAVGNSMGKTDSGDEFRVFATVVAMMKKWISTVGIEHVEGFDFGANKDEHASDGRAKLYTRFAKQLASKLGWKLEQSTTGNGDTAFFRLVNPKPIPRDDEYWDALDEDVTQSQLNALEKVVDKVFGQVGIDVEFTRHFLDRANDARNGEPISIKELAMLFKKEYQRWGKPIAQMGPNAQAVLKDLESDINVPFVLQWDREGNELDMIAKTVMRKKDFRTSNKEFPVEALTNNVMQRAQLTFEISSNSRTNENFADGKKKGKSRPGRVKRSGASCDGSVTELRKKAKNSSGEKAKMYHWCANMKSGRKKSK